MRLKDLVSLSAEQRKHFKGSFDLIGDIAILEIDKELNPKKREIALAVKKIYPFVKTVLNKKEERKGKLRLRKYETILGNSNETIHKENGCQFKLDVKKVYFSPREGTERMRIAEQVKPNETILVLFGGIAPYAINIAKKQPKVHEIYSIELNKDAHRYALDNVRLNKLNNIVYPILGDAKDAVKQFRGKCNRVIMPLPKEGYKYLDIAIKCLKRNGFIHFYAISESPEQPMKQLEEAARKQKRKVKILKKRFVLPYKPRMYKWCIEAKVL